MRNLIIVAMVSCFSLSVLAADPVSPTADPAKNIAVVKKSKQESSARIIELQNQLIAQQSENLAVFNLVTKPFKTGTICFDQQPECDAKAMDVRLLTNEDVIVQTHCRLADRSELSL